MAVKLLPIANAAQLKAVQRVGPCLLQCSPWGIKKEKPVPSGNFCLGARALQSQTAEQQVYPVPRWCGAAPQASAPCGWRLHAVLHCDGAFAV